MATVAGHPIEQPDRQDRLSGTPRAHPVDRWIYVFTAASFIVICLAGFIPSSIEKIAAVQAGARPPFPLVLHMHAVLMGAFLLLLLAQTTLVATGRCALHMKLGLTSVLLVPAIVVVGFLLAISNYHGIAGLAQSAPAEARAPLQDLLLFLDNILLLQMKVGILFPLLFAIGLAYRGRDAGMHKRMMILAPAMALPAGIDRIAWLPTTLPASPIATDFYTLLAISPMLVWDLVRNGSLHRAYWIAFAFFLPATLLVNGLWDTPGWHSTVRQMMGV
jgi:hypothetical protein